jgi:ATP/maltotriose-dependent transcriptional regulator MalT
VRSFIQDLRERNLFVTTIDDATSVIRYHSLFREFLKRKLITQSDPNEVRKLYSIAANYFKSTGDAVRVVDLLISSGQFDQAVKTIESSGLELIGRGQVQTLLRWIQALPLDYVSRPWFLLYRAIAFRFIEPRKALTFFDLLSRVSAMLAASGTAPWAACSHSAASSKRPFTRAGISGAWSMRPQRHCRC